MCRSLPEVTLSNVKNLEDGATIEEFIEWFPGVTRKQVEAVLEFTAASLGVPISA